ERSADPHGSLLFARWVLGSRVGQIVNVCVGECNAPQPSTGLPHLSRERRVLQENPVDPGREQRVLDLAIANGILEPGEWEDTFDGHGAAQTPRILRLVRRGRLDAQTIEAQPRTGRRGRSRKVQFARRRRRSSGWGRYELLRLGGVGGMGEVYLAR